MQLETLLAPYTPLYHLRKVTCTGSRALATYFPHATGSKQRKFIYENYQLQKLIHVILHILCCIKTDNIILRLFLLSQLENDSTVTWVSLNLRSAKFTLSCGSFHTPQALYDTHLSECFELQLIFGFEQSSFDNKKNEFKLPIEKGKNA